MLIVPLDPVPSQTITISLDGQLCKIHAYQRSTGFYLDLSVNDSLVVGGVLCHDRNRIVRSDYLGFSGDLAFADMQGLEDPFYTGLGSRWLLEYYTADEVAQLIAPTVTTTLWVPQSISGAPLPTPAPTPAPTPGPTPTPAPTPAPTQPPTQTAPGAPSGVTIT